MKKFTKTITFAIFWNKLNIFFGVRCILCRIFLKWLRYYYRCIERWQTLCYNVFGFNAMDTRPTAIIRLYEIIQFDRWWIFFTRGTSISYERKFLKQSWLPLGPCFKRYLLVLLAFIIAARLALKSTWLVRPHF